MRYRARRYSRIIGANRGRGGLGGEVVAAPGDIERGRRDRVVSAPRRPPREPPHRPRPTGAGRESRGGRVFVADVWRAWRGRAGPSRRHRPSPPATGECPARADRSRRNPLAASNASSCSKASSSFAADPEPRPGTETRGVGRTHAPATRASPIVRSTRWANRPSWSAPGDRIHDTERTNRRPPRRGPAPSSTPCDDAHHTAAARLSPPTGSRVVRTRELADEALPGRPTSTGTPSSRNEPIERSSAGCARGSPDPTPGSTQRRSSTDPAATDASRLPARNPRTSATTSS